MTDARPDDGAVVPEPDGEEIAAFWTLARGRAGLGRLAVLIGTGGRAAVPPPVVALADTPRSADRLLEQVLDGTTTATATAAWELTDAGQPLPEPGDLSIVVDGRGHPRALVRTTSVRLLRLADVDAEHVAAEGHGAMTAAEWASRFGEDLRRRAEGTPHVVGPDTDVVLERFEVRFPPHPRATAGSPVPAPAPVA